MCPDLFTLEAVDISMFVVQHALRSFFSLAKGSWLFVQLLSDDDDDKQVGMKGAKLPYLKACTECKIVFKYIDAVY